MDGTEMKGELIDICGLYARDTEGRTPEDAASHAAWLDFTRQRLVTGLFRVVVMGEIKKGKSSFINALLGIPDLLPTASDVATSTVYKIAYGPKLRYTVFFESRAGDPDSDAQIPVPSPREITREELDTYGTEKGNPENSLGVEFISVECPHPLLEQGVVFVDTPGVGGLFQKHREITFRYAPNADAVFFVLDSVEAVIGQEELDFLQELRKVTEHICFVQTKTDATDGATVGAWKDRNIGLISRTLGWARDRIRYFLISSTLKELADTRKDRTLLEHSGYVAILTFLVQSMIPQKDRLVAGIIAKELLEHLAADGRLIASHLNVLREEDETKLRDYKAALTKAQRDATAWELDAWKPRYEAFTDSVQDLKLKTQNKIGDIFSTDSDEFRELMDSVRRRFTSPDEVTAVSSRMRDDYAASCSAAGRAVCEGYVSEFMELYLETLESVAADLDRTIDVAVQSVSAHWTTPVARSGRFDAMRTAVASSGAMGQIAGAGAVAFGTAAAILGGPITIGAAAVAGVAYLGARIWGATKGYKAARQNQLGAALAELQQSLQLIANRGKKAALKAYGEVALQGDRVARNGFQEYISSRKSELKNRIDQITAAQAASVDERRTASNKLGERMARLRSLNDRVRAAVGQDTTPSSKAAPAHAPADHA